MRIVNLVENTPGVPGCRYEHGLSFYIETKKHRILVDSGATDIFLQNAETLGIDLTIVDTMFLSHGHYDHAGGILAFSRVNHDAKIYLKASAGEDFYHLNKGGEKYIGIDKKILKLEQCVFVQGDLEIDDELFLYTDVSGRRYPAKGNQKLRKKIDGVFIQDAFDHEQCLVITQDCKRILLSGCAHNGILNILDRYKEIFHADPDIVISGFHLMKEGEYTQEDILNIQNIAHELAEMDTVFYTGHCTGEEACVMMKEIMGEKLQVMHSGVKIL